MVKTREVKPMPKLSLAPEDIQPYSDKVSCVVTELPDDHFKRVKPNPKAACRQCNGTGFVKEYHGYDVICPKCSGTGFAMFGPEVLRYRRR
jgi:DnaJ-class molecular chaperone